MRQRNSHESAGRVPSVAEVNEYKRNLFANSPLSRVHLPTRSPSAGRSDRTSAGGPLPTPPDRRTKFCTSKGRSSEDDELLRVPREVRRDPRLGGQRPRGGRDHP